MSKKKFSGGISAKGYYIALVLCAVAIGITGFLYYRNVNEPVSVQDPTAQPVDNTEDGLQVVAPDGETPPPATETPRPQKPNKLVVPLSGEIVVPYAMDALTYNPTTRDWRVHRGVDIAADAGTEVCAAADGTVYSVHENEKLGMTVVINHDGGYVTEYASLSQQVQVKAGDQVTAGQTIGTVGETALMESAVGEHLHFSVSCDGKLVDPAEFLEQG